MMAWLEPNADQRLLSEAQDKARSWILAVDKNGIPAVRHRSWRGQCGYRIDVEDVEVDRGVTFVSYIYN